MSSASVSKVKAVAALGKQACLGILLSGLCLGGCHNPPRPEPERPQTGPPPAEARAQLMSFTEAPSIPALASGQTRPPTPDEFGKALSTEAERWLYGPGFGRTLVNVGTVVIFPPYVLYLLGNAGLSLLGYEPVYVTDALPEEPRSGVLNVYNSVTAVPGRVNSIIAGREFIQQ